LIGNQRLKEHNKVQCAVESRKYPHLHLVRLLENPYGWRVSNARLLKEDMKLNWNFQRGRHGVFKQKELP